MASWIQNQLKAAEDLLQAVDRTAQKVSNLRDRDDRLHPAMDSGPGSGSRSVGNLARPLMDLADISICLGRSGWKQMDKGGLVQEDARARHLSVMLR